MQYPIIKISAFGSHFSKYKNKVVPGGKPSQTDFFTEMVRIRDGYYKALIDELRSITNEDEQKKFKESKLLSFTTSALIEQWRDEKNVKKHSGLLNIDIDGDQNLHITDWDEFRDRLSDQMPIVAAFISARRNGLSFIIRIDPSKHETTYDYVAWELQRKYNIFTDTSCKNLTRLRFVSYDPRAFINFDIDKIPTIVPSEEFYKTIKARPVVSLLNVTKGDSEELFENSIRHTEAKQHQDGNKFQFSDGQKYWYIISIAGYCNSHGMTEDFCKQMVNKRFGNLTSADIITPIADIYRRYSHQFASVPFNDPSPKVLRDKLRIDLTEEVPPPPSVIEVQHKDDLLRFITLGNFSMIIGKAKSRKTFFISLVAASFLKGKLFMNKFLRRFTPGKTKLILFDTEQGLYDVHLLAKKIMLLTGIDTTPLIEVYHLRTLDTKARIDFIEEVLYNTEELAMVIIDGIRDLVYDINSPEEATHTANRLLKWTEEANIHIMTILHQNKGDANGRGHLGTELTNKAESVLSITRDPNNKEWSIITPEYFRGKEFDSFAFKIAEDGLPVILDEFMQPPEEAKNKAVIAHQIHDVTHKDILISMFDKNKEPKWKDMIIQIKLGFQQMGINFGDNKAGEFLSYYQSRGWVAKDSTTLGRYPHYTLTTPL